MAKPMALLWEGEGGVTEDPQGRQRGALGRRSSRLCRFGGQAVRAVHFEKQLHVVGQVPAFLSHLEIGLSIIFLCLLSVSPLDIKLHQGRDCLLSPGIFHIPGAERPSF